MSHQLFIFPTDGEATRSLEEMKALGLEFGMSLQRTMGGETLLLLTHVVTDELEAPEPHILRVRVKSDAEVDAILELFEEAGIPVAEHAEATAEGGDGLLVALRY